MFSIFALNISDFVIPISRASGSVAWRGVGFEILELIEETSRIFGTIFFMKGCVVFRGLVVLFLSVYFPLEKKCGLCLKQRKLSPKAYSNAIILVLFYLNVFKFCHFVVQSCHLTKVFGMTGIGSRPLSLVIFCRPVLYCEAMRY